MNCLQQTDKIEGPKPQSFDIEATTALMEHTYKLTSLKNNNSEEDDWELKVLKFGWTPKHTKLFNKVVRILDYDRLSRLSCPENKRQEIMQVRVTIDKSAERMRKALASVEWEVQLVQWLHTTLMENLPATYMSYYLDIMQTLKSIVPSLVDKMIFWKPGNINQDLLASVLKKPWQPTLVHMVKFPFSRKIPSKMSFLVSKAARKCINCCNSAITSSLNSATKNSTTLHALHNNVANFTDSIKHRDKS